MNPSKSHRISTHATGIIFNIQITITSQIKINLFSAGFHVGLKAEQINKSLLCFVIKWPKFENSLKMSNIPITHMFKLNLIFIISG